MGDLPNSLHLQFLGFLVALAVCALFSFLETSITALRLFKIKELAESTQKYKELFQTIEKHPHRIIITILIVSSLANATSAALITHIMETLFARFNLSEGLGFSIGIFIATSSILIFGEIIPKNIARLHGEGLLKSTLWITNTAFYLLYPFVKFLTKISDFVTNRIGKKPSEHEPSEKEIQFLIDYIDEKGLMDPDKTEMLQNIFRLGKKPVKEIMVPEIDVITIDSTTKIKDALPIFTKYQFSRLPIFEKDPDNIIGIVYLKDIFLQLEQKAEDKTIKDIIRPIIFVPESLKVNQMLKQLKQKHMHMAMVLTEYGGISGLVTLEDVLEEIVGEIADEYESISDKIITLKENEWLVDAAIPLETLAEVLNITFEAEDVFTLGGFITEQLQHLPKKGDRISYKEYCFQIQKASPKRVLQVLVFKDNNCDLHANLNHEV